MKKNEIMTICNSYMNKKKGYSAEIDNLSEDNEHITFNMRILKRGAFRAVQTIVIIKTSGLSANSQLSSQVERFSALVENNRI